MQDQMHGVAADLDPANVGLEVFNRDIGKAQQSAGNLRQPGLDQRR